MRAARARCARPPTLRKGAHGLDPSGWGAGQVSRAPGLEKVDRFGHGCLKLFESRTLRLIRLDNLRNLINAPVRHTRGLAGAEAADLCTWGFKAPTSPDVGRVNSGSVDTSDAVIHVIIRTRPEGVVGVGIERVVQEIIVRIWPEQRSDEANSDDRQKTLVMPERKLREATAEDRVCQGRPVHE